MRLNRQSTQNISILLILLITCTLTISLNAQTKKDSLWKEWNNKARPDSIRLTAYNKYITEYYLNKKSDSALYHLNILVEQAQQLHKPTIEADAINSIGIYYRIHQQPQEAIDFITKSIRLNTRINNLNGLGSNYNTLGLTYYDLEQFDKATECYYKSLKYFETTNNENEKAPIYSNLGMIYGVLKDTNNAILYFKKAFTGTLKTNNYRRQIIAAFNLSMYELMFPETRDSAEHYLLTYIEKSKELGYKNLELNLLSNLADLYMKKGDYKTSLFYRNKILPIASEINDSMGIANYYYHIGRTHYEQDQRSQTVEPVLKSLNIYLRAKHWNMTRRSALFLSDVYAELGNFEQSLKYYKIYVEAKDSLHGTQAEKALFKEQTKYEFEKKAIEIKAKNEKTQLELRAEATRHQHQKQRWIIILIGLTLILSVVFFFYLKNIRQKKIIAEQRADIIKQKLLVSQINPHFIFNSLNAIQNFIFKEDALVAGEYLSQFARLMRMILNFSREEQISLASEIEFMKTYLELQKLRFADSFTYSIEIDEEIEVEETMISPLLGQPFVENAIEHGIKHLDDKNGIVLLRFSINGNTLVYEIDDNGIGLQPKSTSTEESPNKNKSLATIITRERMETLSSQGKAYELIITNKKDTAENTQGVNVKIKVPYCFN